MALELFPRRRENKNWRESLFPTPEFQPRLRSQAMTAGAPFLPPEGTNFSPMLYAGGPTDLLTALTQSGGMPQSLAGVPGLYSPRSTQADFLLGAGGLLGPGGESLGQAPVSPTADAARLLSGATKSNPFLSIEGQARLMSGRAPLPSEVGPEFWGTTSPTIRDALIGLYRSMGMRPEDLEFFFESTRIPGL